MVTGRLSGIDRHPPSNNKVAARAHLTHKGGAPATVVACLHEWAAAAIEQSYSLDNNKQNKTHCYTNYFNAEHHSLL